ncbi:MAG: CAP domain-containing protein [Bacteroidota bacterium]|nr:CAP domain-containing protein [Bacteroidota bacterium]
MTVRFTHKKLSLAFLLFAISIFNGNSLYGQINEEYNISNEVWDSFKLKNAKESRLIEFKDNDEQLLAKLVLLELINKHRKKHHKQPVELDIHACRSANKTAQDAALNKYIGHWDSQGKKPYHRYALDGGDAHVSENASGVESTDFFKQDIDEMISLMKENHMLMYNERPPFDGHRLNILDPYHNLLGLGVAYDGSSFCYYEEFINDYLTKSSTELQNGEVSMLFTIPDQFNLVGISISYDKPFKPMTRKELNTKTSYLDEGETNIFIWDDEVMCKDNNCEYSFRIKSNQITYVKVLISKIKPDEFVKDSKGSFPVSGWVFYKGMQMD